MWLAMRDTSKVISAIPSEVEKLGRFTRVHADLTDPSSITTAVQESGAKAAYIYLAFGSPDSMRGTLQALHNAGIESLVFLSSFHLRHNQDLRSLPVEEFIAFSHAQVEIAAEEIGFSHFTSIRPASFASNLFKTYLDRTSTPVKSLQISDDFWIDNIVPEDIGEVTATALTERPRAGNDAIDLSGPDVITIGQAWNVIKMITGRHDIDSTPISKERFSQVMTRAGLPPPLAADLIHHQEKAKDRETFYSQSDHQAAAENIEKYTGHPATAFNDYIEAHKAEWQAL